MSTISAYTAFALILAAILDYVLMLWLRKMTRRNRHYQPARDEAVYVFGIYSPVLTWLRYRKLPRPPDPAPADDKPAEIREMTQGEEDETEAAGQPVEVVKARWWQGVWLEWVVIILAVLLFCIGILDLRSPTRLPGNESEIFQMLDWTLVNSLRYYRQFPLWNPYIHTGIPYIADPMLHVYNPVVTLPVLLFGVRAGFKLGIFFSFGIAALGMWRLGRVMGMGRAARLWMALMYAFAGQPVARFFQGQYLFVLGFAWIPWIVSGLILALRTGRRRYIALTAFPLVLLFFSGNAYYPVYTLLAVVLLGLVMLMRFKLRPPFLSVNPKQLQTYLLIGVLTVGMIAIQLFPTAEFWPRLSKDLNLAGSHTLEQIFQDYTSKDSYRPDAFSVLPAREEFYAYIGLTPFLALSLLPLAFWKRDDRRSLIFFILLALLVVGWISSERTPWREFFMDTRLLVQFRHLLRILVFGSFALIALAGFGLDTLWKQFTEAHQTGKIRRVGSGHVLTRIGLVALGLFMLFGVGDLYNTNQQLLRTQAIYKPAFDVMRWLGEYDASVYYVRHTPTNAWHEATISNNMRFIETWYHFADIRSLDDKVNERYVLAQPYYLTQSPNEQAPEGAELVEVVEEYNVFRLPESLPMAFLVTDAELQRGGDAGALLKSQVTPLSPYFPGPSGVEVIAEAQTGQWLVVLVTHYPGWQVTVDGEEQELQNVSGYLAIEAQPGVHKYSFAFRPRSFYYGLLVSLVATGITFYLFASDISLSRRALQQSARASVKTLTRLKQRWMDWVNQQKPLSGEAIYQQGALHLQTPVPLPEEAHVRVTLEPHPLVAGASALLRRWLWTTAELAGALARTVRLETALFTFALGLYLLTRLIGLANFPIYFFTDEAVQTVMAEDFLQNGLRNYSSELLPTYFNRDSTYNLSSASVYMQVIPYLLFGKSVFITRAVSVAVGTFGAVMVGLILRDIFKIRYWWSGVLLLSIAPAWFLHSRTAFETVEMVAFYAGFLYFYLRYRYISPRALYPALIFGALVFYTYSPGQLIIVVTGIFLLLSDIRYHWRNRPVALRGLLLLILLALPFLRFYLAHPEAPRSHLTTRAPYWLENKPLTEKLGTYFAEYQDGLNPLYWFTPNPRADSTFYQVFNRLDPQHNIIPDQHDLDRHLMKGYAHLPLATLPLYLIGLVLAVWKLPSSAHRAVLLALLAAPVGSALVEIGITRILIFIIPAILLITLGLDACLAWLERLIRRWKPVSISMPRVFSLALVVALSWANLAMLRDALVNGPTWFQDYTLAGMQYGAEKLFDAVNEYVRQNPEAELLVSPSWTNGADAVAQFFLPENAPVRMGSVEGHLFQHLLLPENLVFVMIPDEYNKVVTSGKFEDIRVEQVLYYPNGDPGFYFVRLRYVDNIDDILSAERDARRILQEAVVLIDGQSVTAHYSMLDMGSLDLAFDGNDHTLVRTLEANPFVVELTFPEPRYLTGISLIVGSAYMEVTVQLYASPEAEAVTFSETFDGSVTQPEMTMDFGRSVTTQVLHIEIRDPTVSEPANIHLWEITLR